MMRTTLNVILGALLPGAEVIDRTRFDDALSAYLEQSRWHLAFSLLRAPHWLSYPGRRVGVRAARELRGTVLWAALRLGLGLRSKGDTPMRVEPRQRPLTEQAPHR